MKYALPAIAATGIAGVGVGRLSAPVQEQQKVGSGMVPLTTRDAIACVSAEWGVLDPTTRHDLAVELRSACAVDKLASLPDRIFVYSGESLSPFFQDRIIERIERLPYGKEELAKQYEKVASYAPIADPEDTVAVLSELDQEAGFYGKYATIGMPDAVQTVFEPAPETPWGADIGSIHVSEAGIRAIRGDEETLAKGYKALGGKLDELFEDPATTFERMTTDTRNVVATLVHRASRG